VLVVVVDTSTPAVTAAVARVEPDGVEVLAERVSVDERAHGELLAPGVAGALAAAGVPVGELAAIVAGLGPGPFTGLRVGLATAAAMGQALAIPTYGVCSLDGIGARTAGTTLVATDARRKEIYWAVYRDGVRLGDPEVHRPGDLPGVLATLGLAPSVAAGDAAPRYAAELGLPVREDLRYPDPAALVRAAADRIRGGAGTEPLTPLYLRRPDAVEPAARKPVGR
jgi:tRNA threonylcarbamoyl adenosine modification protein YeaZ